MHPLEGGNLVEKPVVPGGSVPFQELRKRQIAKGAETVVDGYEDDAVGV